MTFGESMVSQQIGGNRNLLGWKPTSKPLRASHWAQTVASSQFDSAGWSGLKTFEESSQCGRSHHVVKLFDGEHSRNVIVSVSKYSQVPDTLFRLSVLCIDSSADVEFMRQTFESCR